MAFETLATIWFVLLGVLLTGYAILDGFDLGVGMLHPFIAREDRERRVVLNSIGPVWDGNEVWLVTFGGALFAMFPFAYAAIFEGYYNAFMLLLFALIFRAVSIEFRSKRQSPRWRSAWDWGFCLSSGLATLLFGVAVGSAIHGVPLNDRGEFAGTMLDQVTPYSVLVGLLAVAMFAMHGSIYLYLKTEGELQRRVLGWVWRCFGLFLVIFVFVTMYTLQAVPTATDNFEHYPVLWAVPVLNVLAIANIPRAMHLHKPAYAFLSSCATIAAFVLLLTIALFPFMVVSVPNPEHSITVYNAASSAKTLTIGLIIVVIGMPFVLGYTAVVYWSFRGKVELTEHSY